MKNKCVFVACGIGDTPVPKQFDSLSSSLIEREYSVVRIVDGQRFDLVNEKHNPITVTWPSKRPTKLRDGIFLIRLISKYKPVALIANFGSVNWMMMAGWLMKVPIRVAWYHTTSQQNKFDGHQSKMKEKIFNNRKKMIYKLATNLITNSQYCKIDIQNVYNISAQKITVFYNLLEEKNLFEKRTFKSGTEKIIVCPGRLFYIKGQDVLIHAIEKLKDEFLNVRIIFLGDGPERKNLEELAILCNVQSNCEFLGKRPHDQVMEYMSKAYVTVVPSRDEAFGYVNIESMSMGTPVIASGVGGIPEIIRNDVDGYLVPPDDPESLAERLSYLLKNTEIRNKMGENARNRYLDMFELSNGIKEQCEWLNSKIENIQFK